jgi:cell division protein FtsL
MAYSNTKKDKTQIVTVEKLKKVAISGLLVFVTISSLINIYRQVSTLRSARERNESLGRKIEELTTENNNLRQLIEEASKSGSIDRKQREYFGKGTSKDYWLTLPPEDIYPTVKPTDTEAKIEPNIVKWWNLFTK